jgi:hypothetical protein
MIEYHGGCRHTHSVYDDATCRDDFLESTGLDLGTNTIDEG